MEEWKYWLLSRRKDFFCRFKESLIKSNKNSNYNIVVIFRFLEQTTCMEIIEISLLLNTPMITAILFVEIISFNQYFMKIGYMT